MRRGVDVLAQDQPVLEREDVDAVPLEPPALAVGRRRRPLADDEAVAHVRPAAAERQVGPVLEDAREVRRDLVAFDALPGRVVLEDHARRVQRDDRVHVVGVPGLVVAPDRAFELGRRVALAHAASIAVPRTH